jgi:hypothetical protein
MTPAPIIKSGGSAHPVAPITIPVGIQQPISMGGGSNPPITIPVGIQQPISTGSPTTGGGGAGNSGTITGGTTPGSGPAASTTTAPKTSSMFVWALIAIGVLFALEEAS